MWSCFVWPVHTILSLLLSHTTLQKEEINALILSTNLNLAMCYLKTQDNIKAVKFASKALEVDPNSVKGYFRRGLAYLEMKNLDKAEEDLKQAESMNPDDASIAHAVARLNKLNKKAELKQRKALAGIFEKASNEEE